MKAKVLSLIAHCFLHLSFQSAVDVRSAERHAAAASAAARGDELEEQLNAAVRRLRALRAYNAALQVTNYLLLFCVFLSSSFLPFFLAPRECFGE